MLQFMLCQYEYDSKNQDDLNKRLGWIGTKSERYTACAELCFV